MFQEIMTPNGIRDNKVRTLFWVKSIGDYKTRVEATKKITKSEYDLIEKYYVAFCE